MDFFGLGQVLERGQLLDEGIQEVLSLTDCLGLLGSRLFVGNGWNVESGESHYERISEHIEIVEAPGALNFT